MDMWLWIVAAVLAAIFLGSGSLKLSKSRLDLYTSGMTYVEDFPTWAVKLIGLLEVLGAMALVLPPVLQWGLGLVPLAGFGLAGLMAGAVFVRARRSELFITPLVLLVATVAFAVLRLSVEPL